MRSENLKNCPDTFSMTYSIKGEHDPPLLQAVLVAYYLPLLTANDHEVQTLSTPGHDGAYLNGNYFTKNTGYCARGLGDCLFQL